MTLYCTVSDSDIWPYASRSQIKSYDPLMQGVRFRYLTLWCTVSDSDKWPYNSRSVQKSKFTTLSSQYKVKMKNNDPLVSVQGQNEEQRPSRLTRSKSRTTTLSSQYKVKIKNNEPLFSVQGQFKNNSLRPSRLSTRSNQFKIYDPLISVQGQINSKFTTLSSQYKVKMNNNDPLVSVQGQNQEQRPSRLSTRSNSRTTTLLS